ncbi:S8 family serine peptidase [Streptomyces sp. NBC_01478]|uniref:S8 family serine peptidase n=1 Tax=Streptomyces sp. NBC_01478 TaxID=2903882 RepID=UPI002E2F37F4|nr:S8 family serine peptidase [Streptomyces sp. NBC_01478]
MTVLRGLCRARPLGPAVLVAPLLTLLLPSAAAASGTDPLRARQYGLELSGLTDAAEAGARADGVVVAVIDTGVDLDHPDLAGVLVPGRDFVDGDTRPDDENGHGTHVAGVIAAVSGNGIGIAGGAPGARIMPVRVLGADGTGDPAVIADAVRWAVGHGADVINLSLGDTGQADRLRKGGPLDLALREAADRAVVVAAAGNDSQVERVYRAGVPAVVVEAVGPDGQLAAFSNAGDPRSVAAPGVDILSTLPGGYGRMSGTSMAAPHVAAEAALLIGRGADPATARELITGTAHPTGDQRLGAGLIDAAAAVRALGPSSPSAPSSASGSGSPSDHSARSDLSVPSDLPGGSGTPYTPAADSGTPDPGAGGAALLGLSLVSGAALLTAVALFLRRTRPSRHPRYPRHH